MRGEFRQPDTSCLVFNDCSRAIDDLLDSYISLMSPAYDRLQYKTIYVFQPFRPVDIQTTRQLSYFVSEQIK